MNLDQHELEDSLGADRHIISRLMDSFEPAAGDGAGATAATFGEAKKRTSSASDKARCNKGLPSRQKGCGGRGGEITLANRNSLAEVRLDQEEEGTADTRASNIKRVVSSNNAKSAPKGEMTAALAAGSCATCRTPPAEAARRAKTAPLAPIPSSLIMRSSSSPPVQQDKRVKSRSYCNAGAKQRREEDEQRQRQQGERKKQEVRARRKAKERARRRLHRSTTSDDAATDGTGINKSSKGKKKTKNKKEGEEGGEEDILGSGGIGGGTEIPDDHRRVNNNECPPLLRPTAPTTLVPAEAELVEDVSEGQTEPSQTRESRKRGETERLEEEGGTSLGRGEVSCEGAAFVGEAHTAHCRHGQLGHDEQSHQVLKPKAPEGNWSEGEEKEENGEVGEQGEKRRGPQGRDEELSYTVANASCEYSEYGEDDFEDDAAQQQILQPTAPWEHRGEEEKEEEAPERKKDDEEIGLVAFVEDFPNSDYGDEDFEDDVS